MKKRLSVILVLLLALTMTVSLPLTSFAAGTADDDPATVLSVYHGTARATEPDIYSDEVFSKDSAVYDPQLAMMTLDLASASCHSQRYSDESKKYAEISRNVQEFLEDKGFSDIYVTDDYKLKPDGTLAPAYFAHKKINAGGRAYTLLVVGTKSGANEAEYWPITRISRGEGDRGDMAYLAYIKDKVLQAAREYVRSYEISGNIKVWVPGYSRGGGIAQLIAADIIDDPAGTLGSAVSFTPSDVYSYSLSSYRSAAKTRDLTASRYDGIHHLISEDDLIVNLPWETMSFGWIGQVHDMTAGVDKARAMELMRIKSESDYEAYVSDKDPDGFYPKKLDIQALLKGKLSLTDDDESYLPYELDEYIDSVMDPLIELFAENGDDPRDGFYKNYQEAGYNFVKFVMADGLPDASSLTTSKTMVPFVMSAYINYIAGKKAENRKLKTAELNAAIESGFNALAYNIEDENGELRSDIAKLKSTANIYKLLRRLYFTENEDYAAGLNGIPDRYSLRREIESNGVFAKHIRKLTARLYALTMKDIMSAQGADKDLISAVTSDKDSAAMSMVLTYILFGNDRQSSSIRPLDPDNEQFRQLATLIGNISRLTTMHFIADNASWIRAACSWYDGYEGLTESALAGYRRVYIRPSRPVDIIGKVMDEDGNVAARFINDKMSEKTDKWIGYTTSDEGGWLRLPADKSYKVELMTTDDCDMTVKVAEYSAEEGKIVRTVDRDSKYRWDGLVLYAGDVITLNVPAAFGEQDECALPSDAEYSMSDFTDDDGGKAATAAPKVKGLKLKAGKKSIKLSWKKLSAAQRANFSKVELQYSRSKKFKSYKKIYVSKAKASYRIKGLKKGKTYYVRVRNVRKADNKVYVSKWSAVKKAEAK